MGRIFDILDKFYGDDELRNESSEEFRKSGIKEPEDAFGMLVMGILSQNTNDRNSARAYISLAKRLGKPTPEKIAATEICDIEDAIRIGGMYSTKARKIKGLAEDINEKYRGDAGRVAEEEDIRKALIGLTGIGRKTADVFLAFFLGKETIPVDTNINRVSKRLGIACKNAGYHKIQSALEKEIPKGKKLRGHLLLIKLGRDYCKAGRPLCEICPAERACGKII